MQPVELQAFTYEERHGLVPALTSTVSLSGAWILDRKPISPTALEIRLEIQLRFIVEFYAALVAAGVELTRDSHHQLSDLCTCRKHLTADLGEILTIRIELAFLEDLTLHSILMSSSSAA